MPRTLVFISAVILVLSAAPSARGQGDVEWRTVYEDDYRYGSQDPGNTTFNTWFWREDSVGTHTFEYVGRGTPGYAGFDACSSLHPCVKLTAERYVEPGETPYINSEMYNNSCVRQGVGHHEPQAYDKLTDNPWVQTLIPAHVLHQKIGAYCGTPYPYRDSAVKRTARYATSSWNTTTDARLYPNPLAFIADKEPEWQWFRDLAFNSLYVADASKSQRIVMNIKAEGQGGGSRGWGFWNTSLDPFFGQFAWFMEITSQDPRLKSTVWMMTVKGSAGKGGGFCLTPLDPKYSVYAWHQYAIVWSPASVEYFVDGRIVARHTTYVPDLGMAFHNWVDNRNYSSGTPANYPLANDKTNYINRFVVAEKTTARSMLHEAGSKASSDGTTCAPFPGLVAKSKMRKLLPSVIKDVLKAYR